MSNYPPQDIARLTYRCIIAAMHDGTRIIRERTAQAQLDAEQAKAYIAELERQLLEGPKVYVDLSALPAGVDSQTMATLLETAGFVLEEGTRYAYSESNL